MNFLRTHWRWLRSLAQRRAVKQEIDEELRFHIDQRTAGNISAGMSPEEAAREARKRFGNFQNAREECRRVMGANFGESVVRDIQFGLRMLWKNPGFTAVAVLTLALGIGATTAIYSVVNSVLLNPIPGPQPERMVQIAEELYTENSFKEENNQPLFIGVSPPVLQALEEQRDFFSEIAWADQLNLQRKTADFVETIYGAQVPPNFFKLWNVQPLLGRTFAPDEGVRLTQDSIPERDSVIILNYALWQKLFAGDRSVIGRTIELSGLHFTVIGVMPKWFGPEGAYPRYWLPVELSPVPSNYMTGPNTRVVARLRPETTQRQAQAMLDALAARLMKDYPGDVKFGYGREWHKRPHGLNFWIRPVSAGFQDDKYNGHQGLERTLFGLLGAIVFVLLIACANIANLTLARTERRQHEFSIRASIGAGRGRLVRQMLTESLLLSFFGGLGGVLVSFWGMKVLLALVPASMPRLRPVAVDGHAMAYTLLISIATGLLFGLVPACRAGRTPLGEALKQAGAGATAGLGRSRYRSTLVVAEVALAVVLLAGAGLMIKSVIRMLHVDPGFDPENLVRVNLYLPWDKYNNTDQYGDPKRHVQVARLRQALYEQLEDRLAALPGVRAVGIGKHGAWPLQLKAEGRSEQVELVLDGCSAGSNNLFQAMRIPLLAGRLFDSEDLGAGAGAAIISETMARAVWPGEQAVGKRFGGATPYGDQTFTVVGVVGDIRDSSYSQQLRPIFYRPCDELYLEGMAPFVVIRTQAAPQTLVPAIRRELKAAEPGLGMPDLTVETQQLYDSTQAQRTYMLYLVVFAGVGVLLCAIGVYGVLAYSVARRVREIGIRIAVGAQRGDVVEMVMMQGMRLVLVGAGVGLLAAFWLTRLLRSQLFEVSPNDPAVMAAVVVLLLAVALLACYLPARRAARINPTTALRYE
jgi:predicted permease